MTVTRKDNIVEDFHGTKVSDPYRWLEDPASDETIAWSDNMAQQGNAYFAKSPSKSEDKKRLEELWNYPKYFVPEDVKGHLFFQKNDGVQNQAVLYRRTKGADEVVIDPNQLSDDGTVAMTSYEVSHDGKYIGYAASNHGSDWHEIYVRDVSIRRKTYLIALSMLNFQVSHGRRMIADSFIAVFPIPKQ